MADVQSRPSHRTSRGGSHSSRGRSSYSSRGPAPSRPAYIAEEAETVFESTTSLISTQNMDVNLQKLKSQYANGLQALSELFPDWSDEDLLYLLSETSGEVEAAVVRITEGSLASQWGEVKKKGKERSKSKGPAENSRPATTATATRGRARGHLESRGRGGRSERGRSRGGAKVSGSRIVTEEPSSTDISKPAEESATPTAVATPTPTSLAVNGESTHEIVNGWNTIAAGKATSTLASVSTPASVPANAGGELNSVWGSATDNTTAAITGTATTIVTNESTTTAKDTTSTVSASASASSNAWDQTVSATPNIVPTTTQASALISTPKSSVIKPGAKMSWASIAKPAESKSEHKEVPVIPETNPESDVKTVEEWKQTSFVTADASVPDPLTHENLDRVANDGPEPPASSLASNVDSSVPSSISTTSSSTYTSTSVPKPPSAIPAKSVPTGGRSPAYPRMLHQDAPVVMPGSVQAQVERAGLQFGSLNLADSREEETFETSKEQISTPASQKVTPSYVPAQENDVASIPTQAPVQGLSGFGGQNQASRYVQQQPQQAQQPQIQAQQKTFESFSQSPYGTYPTQTHIPGFGGFSMPNEFQPYGADPQRHAYQNYYGSPYQPAATTATQDGLQRTAVSTSLDQLTPSSTSTQPTRFGVGPEPSQSSPAPTTSPGISTQHNQYNIHPYYLTPAYTAYYMNNMSNMNNFQGYYGHQQTQPQFSQQKSMYGQQQSPFYGDHYTRSQQLQQLQQQQQLQNAPQAQQAQQVQQQGQQGGKQTSQQQQTVSSLGGIPDFLQRDEPSKSGGRPSSSAGQQVTQQAQPTQIPPPQSIPQQQNMYGGFGGYPPYGMSQQAGRQGGWSGYGH
ncbi:hypothetical protein V1511DRAFT_481015 [Dipodascopsis uninucleata]